MMALLFWNALVYVISLSVLSIAIWKSVVLAIVVTASAVIGYGKQWIYRFGVALMVLAVLVALSILPPVEQWPTALAHLRSLV
jgi:hypothetical protein